MLPTMYRKLLCSVCQIGLVLTYYVPRYPGVGTEVHHQGHPGSWCQGWCQGYCQGSELGDKPSKEQY